MNRRWGTVQPLSPFLGSASTARIRLSISGTWYTTSDPKCVIYSIYADQEEAALTSPLLWPRRAHIFMTIPSSKVQTKNRASWIPVRQISSLAKGCAHVKAEIDVRDLVYVMEPYVTFVKSFSNAPRSGG